MAVEGGGGGCGVCALVIRFLRPALRPVQVNFGLHDLNNNGKEVPLQDYTDNLKSIFATIQARQVLATDCCDRSRRIVR